MASFLSGRHVGRPGASWRLMWDTRAGLSVHRMIRLHAEIESELNRHFDARAKDVGLPSRADWRLTTDEAARDVADTLGKVFGA